MSQKKRSEPQLILCTKTHWFKYCFCSGRQSCLNFTKAFHPRQRHMESGSRPVSFWFLKLLLLIYYFTHDWLLITCCQATAKCFTLQKSVGLRGLSGVIYQIVNLKTNMKTKASVKYKCTLLSSVIVHFCSVFQK